MLTPGDAEQSETPGSEPGPVGLFTCEAPGRPHSLGQCSCGATWFRRLPATPGGTSRLSLAPFPFPDFVDSPESAAADPAAAAAAVLPGPGELQSALMFGAFATFVDSPDSAAADPAAALRGARRELQPAVPFGTFVPLGRQPSVHQGEPMARCTCGPQHLLVELCLVAEVEII